MKNGDMPASPVSTPINSDEVFNGLTKRELLAAHQSVPNDLSMSWGELMVGPCPCRDDNGALVFDDAVVRWWAQVEAKYRVVYADALLAELEKSR